MTLIEYKILPSLSGIIQHSYQVNYIFSLDIIQMFVDYF